MNTKKSIPDNWFTIEIPNTERPADLPTHIWLVTYKGEPSGYRVDYFVKYENGKPLTETKSYTNMKISMETKLDLAKDYVADLDKKYIKIH